MTCIDPCDIGNLARTAKVALLCTPLLDGAVLTVATCRPRSSPSLGTGRRGIPTMEEV